MYRSNSLRHRHVLRNIERDVPKESVCGHFERAVGFSRNISETASNNVWTNRSKTLYLTDYCSLVSSQVLGT